MDDEGFDDLLAGTDFLPGSSQESLTEAAANLDLDIPTCRTIPSAQAHEASDRDEGRKGHQGSETFQKISHDPTSWQISNLTAAEKIENIFKEIQASLMTDENQLSISLQVRPSVGETESRSRLISFPGKVEKEAWRFTIVLRILELMHEAIKSNVVLSKRDLYYRDPALFGSQAVVNRYVDSIAYTLTVPRAALHVTAAAKGLVAGAFNICRRDGSIVSAANHRDGLLVPTPTEILSLDMSAVKWILVIEKEASFRSIAASNFYESMSTKGIIMTGKGYPDVATRALLRFMTMASPQNGFASPPVFCLVDFDPDGLAIMSTYKNGSAALAHENEELRVPQTQWLGFRSDAFGRVTDELHGEQGLLALTFRDRRKAVSMLARQDPYASDKHEAEVRNALQTMLMLNTKAELQLLDASPRGMEDLLRSALGGLE